ncbi:hypothetical protein GcM1_222013 [Golovinomyces cichoracearum]|uniref:Uncharacterized protein n=1 Tax=Golovinomyces cichoracearum TaxID=62708 RepID=A0A420IRC4_9PEZI|nr:hypothetical protein GcM1_222013 [Golovinomyces cichoracearum]
MSSSDNSATQKSSQGCSSRSPHAPKTEGPSLKIEMGHQKKKGLQVLFLEHWNKEAVLNEDSSSVAITSFAMAFVVDWDSIPEVYSPSAVYDRLIDYFGHWTEAMFEKFASPYKQTFGEAIKIRGFKKDRLSVSKWIIKIRDDENFIAPGDEHITLPQPSLLTPTHQPTPPSHLNRYQQTPLHYEQSQPPIQRFQPPLSAQTYFRRPIENAEHHQQTATSMQSAQHNNPSLANRRNH